AARASRAGTVTRAGPYGREASWVIDENKRPGTTAWKIRGARGSIAGFAGLTYAGTGQQVRLFVSTAASTLRAEAFRMGYYQGKGARLIWQSADVAGRLQPACPVTAGINMVSCDTWKPSLSFTVTPAFVPGDYLIKLVGSQGQQSYVPLTIWDPDSAAAYLIKNDVYTWQAWNPYGGYDFSHGPPWPPAAARRTSTRCARCRGWSPSTGPTMPRTGRAISWRSSTRSSGSPRSTAWTSPTPPTLPSSSTLLSCSGTVRCFPSATTSAGR